MNSTILARAALVVPDNRLLVNIVRLRVRQLTLGHRPLIAAPPGMGMADIALTEIAEDKLTSEATLRAAPSAPAAPMIIFPIVAPKKKAA